MIHPGFLGLLAPIVQDPRYHAFADGRTLLAVPNFWNTVSNAPFLVVALYGIGAFRSRTAFVENWERIAYAVLLAGTAGVSAGSAWYHLHPDDTRLFWDRLPMTLVFLSLVATTVGERFGMRVGKRLLLPLLALGPASVVVWKFWGDLRFYGIVQFGSVLAVMLMLVLRPARYTRSRRVWYTVILYGVAKLLELADRRIGLVVATGGHPWKHLAAAAAILVYLTWVAQRETLGSANTR